MQHLPLMRIEVTRLSECSIVAIWRKRKAQLVLAGGSAAELQVDVGHCVAQTVTFGGDFIRTRVAEPPRSLSKGHESMQVHHVREAPDGNDAAFRKAGYFDTHQGKMLQLGLECGFAPKEDVLKVYNWCLRHGSASPKGLCANHAPRSDLGSKHYWYTTSSEIAWQDCFLRIGRRDLADLVFDALMKYSITTEYYVGERYRDDTPWYYPWSPNASGSGRIIQMLLRNQ